jgi:hypothetical protein
MIPAGFFVFQINRTAANLVILRVLRAGFPALSALRRRARVNH